MRIKNNKYKITNKLAKNKKKIIASILLIVCCIFIYSIKSSYATPENNNYNLFFPKIYKHDEPTELLVMVLLYDDYTNHDDRIDYVFNMTDEEIENKYSNEIFGSGTIEDQTWSINDYYKENSNGKFYFKPLLIGENKTGIYPVKLNKNYDPNNFSSDMKEGFKILIDKGFIPEEFERTYDRFQKKKILCIFPKIRYEHLGTYSLTDDIVSDIAVTTYTSDLSTTIHELGHSLGLPDLYNQGNQATLMGPVIPKTDISDIRYPGNPHNYNIQPHMDPLHKIVLGWQDYDIIDKNTTVRLYPTTSSLYKPIIIPTYDNNQYYIIENRQANSFESQIDHYGIWADIDDPEDRGFSNYEGVNIWRVDQLGYSKLSSSTLPRKGDFVIGCLKYENEDFFPKLYSDSENSSSNLKENTNIKITYVKKYDDGSIDININFDEKYKNSYTVRYNSNDGTNNYIDKQYLYTEKVEFPSQLFAKEGYKFEVWNTKKDGSGTSYNPNYYNDVYGLTDEKDGIFNLYAQWKKEKYIISFDANGGTGTMENIELTRNMINDGYILPENQFQKENYKFKGWYVPEYGAIKQPGEKVFLSDDTTLIVQWESNLPNNKCYINFNTNGGTNINFQQITKGGLVSEPQAPIKEGYVFAGWYEDNSYKIKFYFSKRVYSDLTLHAKWIPIENIIKNIDMKMEIPTVGEEVTIKKEKFEDSEYWDWNSQKPQMNITISNGEHYRLPNDEQYNYMYWITKDSFETILDPYDTEPFIGKFEYDTEYYAKVYLEVDDGYLFDNDIIISVNGQNTTKIIYKNEEYIELGVILKTPKKMENNKYTILEGTNQNYFPEKDENLLIKADGEITNFETVKVDDIILDKENYTVTSGSTIISLKKSYLETLINGTHKITFIYKDGEVSTTFTIIDSRKEDSSNIKNNDETTTKSTELVENKKELSPKTGDKIILWIVTFIISLIITIITLKKIRSNHEVK